MTSEQQYWYEHIHNDSRLKLKLEMVKPSGCFYCDNLLSHSSAPLTLCTCGSWCAVCNAFWVDCECKENN